MQTQASAMLTTPDQSGLPGAGDFTLVANGSLVSLLERLDHSAPSPDGRETLSSETCSNTSPPP
jgi:hypothetical protein